jgi:hypothetical protein
LSCRTHSPIHRHNIFHPTRTHARHYMCLLMMRHDFPPAPRPPPLVY